MKLVKRFFSFMQIYLHNMDVLLLRGDLSNEHFVVSHSLGHCVLMAKLIYTSDFVIYTHGLINQSLYTILNVSQNTLMCPHWVPLFKRYDNKMENNPLISIKINVLLWRLSNHTLPTRYKGTISM